MKKFKSKLITTSITALTASTIALAPLCTLSKNLTPKTNTATSNVAYATVEFTTGSYGTDVTITGTAKVRAKVGRQLCSITHPTVLHKSNWKFKGWSKDGTTEISETEVITSDGLTLTPLFEEPIDITNCMGVSAIEKTTVTINLQTTSVPDLWYTTDFGKNWSQVTSSTNSIEIAAGSSIYFRGDNKENGISTSDTNFTSFSFNNKVNLFGNVLSLIYNGETVTKISKIPKAYCFYHMFQNCTTIVNIADNFLPSEGVNASVGVEAVTDALKEHCYEGMFMGCTGITRAPRLFATNDCVKNAQYCYKDIYSGCSNVNYVRTRFTGIFGSDDYKNCWSNWAYGVSTSGRLVYDGSDTTTGESAIPTGWDTSKTPDSIKVSAEATSCMADHEYKLTGVCKKGEEQTSEQGVFWVSSDPSVVTIDHTTGKFKGVPFTTSTPKTVTITGYAKANLNVKETIDVITINPIALDQCTKVTAVDGQAKFQWQFIGEGIGTTKELPTFRYTDDDGASWKDILKDTDITIESGKHIYIKGNNPNGLSAGTDTSYTRFATTSGKISIDGDIKSLVFDGRTDLGDTIPCDYCFRSLFQNCNISSISSSYLSFTTLKPHCYESMFEGCSSLTNAPALPATICKDYCYFRMFFECKKLAAVPTLNASTLAEGCYARMFMYCSTITSTPALPATNSAVKCYYMMFQECTSLESISNIALTSLSDYSCFQMFADAGSTIWSKVSIGEHVPQGKTCFFTCPNISSQTGCVTRMFYYNGYTKEPENNKKYCYL